ncbi:hypothetical protein ACS15_5558 [Ralstonia insidiosa]|uniref:Uncharacterized protein n=1 Tax=Ralstonia insidiosa TaxID=190721 RepID=A0AAC9BMA0_9RALS|nr:hypothetical protein ACS15_5558 [Ralstonia insidiosa]
MHERLRDGRSTGAARCLENRTDEQKTTPERRRCSSWDSCTRHGQSFRWILLREGLGLDHTKSAFFDWTSM